MINNDAHNQWEDEYNNAKRLFDKFDKILGIVYDQLKKEESEQERFLKRSDEWKDKPLEEVFIDDLVFDEKGKPIENLFASLKGIHDTIKQEDIDKLPEEQRRIAQKRFKELHELVDRGQRMIDAGKTEEYTDKILGITYDMCKDGFREVASKIDISNIAELFPEDWVEVGDRYKIKESELVSRLGWFNSDNGIIEHLNGEDFNSFTEYLSSKMTPEAFNTIENANWEQGQDSYRLESCIKKFTILKSMGYDTGKYNNWTDMRKVIENAGFYTDRKKGIDSKLFTAFDEIKNNPLKFEQYCEGQTVFDAGIQLVLENIKDMPGIDKNTKSVILIRTEDKDVIPDFTGVNINGKTNINGQVYHPGICESHGHITASIIGRNEKVLTVTRVPFGRIHTVWFAERGTKTPSGKYIKNPDRGNFQFWAYHQNEIDACTQNLPIIKVDGDVLKMSHTYQEAKDELLTWEMSQ